MDNKISPANDGQHRHDDVNDKVRKTFGQNPQNLAYLSLSWIILTFLSLSQLSLAGFIHKFGGFYLPHEMMMMIVYRDDDITALII